MCDCKLGMCYHKQVKDKPWSKYIPKPKRMYGCYK